MSNEKTPVDMIVAELVNVSQCLENFKAGGCVRIVQEAIAHLEPHTQPITPEGLEARGFERYREMWQRSGMRGVIAGLYWTAAAGMMAETGDGDQSSLPGCRTLGDVDDLVRMLEGGDGDT